MRILQAIAGWGTGGAERIALLLTQRLVAADVEVALAAEPGFLDAQVPDAAVRYHVPERGRSGAGTALSVLSMARLLRRFEPSVIHAHGARVPAVALVARRLAAPLRPPPVLATFHAVAPSDMPMAVRILDRVDHVVCVSQAQRQRLVEAGVDADRVSVILNAVAPAEPAAPAQRQALERELDLDGAPVVCLVGRLVEQKRPDRFIDMAAEIAAVDARVRFLVVGDGPLQRAAEAQARERGIASAVRFTGQRHDARPLIARSQVMVFTSTWEGLSVSALEALAAGVPVVATDTDGMRELLASGAGVVVDEHAPAALAREVLALLHDPPRRRAMGALGRELVAARFSAEAMVGSYRELYERLVAQRARSAP